MRTITKGLLILNLVLLLFIVLWLLVGGGDHGYFRGGGSTTEVDGILLMCLAAFNVIFLVTVFFVLPHSSRGKAEETVRELLNEEDIKSDERLRGFLRGWAQWGLAINGVLILFVGLWLLVSSDRFRYFQANATEVDMILLFVISLLDVLFMLLCLLRFSRPLIRTAA